MFQLFYHSGLRVSELLGLKPKHINFKKSRFLGKTYLKKRKRHGECFVYIDSEFMPDLNEYLEKQDKD